MLKPVRENGAENARQSATCESRKWGRRPLAAARLCVGAGSLGCPVPGSRWVSLPTCPVGSSSTCWAAASEAAVPGGWRMAVAPVAGCPPGPRPVGWGSLLLSGPVSRGIFCRESSPRHCSALHVFLTSSCGLFSEQRRFVWTCPLVSQPL